MRSAPSHDRPFFGRVSIFGDRSEIMDIEKAARNAAETMRPDGKPVAGDDITKLRNDVLKQAPL